MKPLLQAKLLLSVCAILLVSALSAQNVAINSDGTLPNANAMLDIKSTQKGLLIPRMTTANRLLIPNTKGLLVFDNDLNSFWFNTGSNWRCLEITGNNWSTKGNSGMLPNNFIGTLDTAIFRIRVNNKQKMLIDTSGFVGIGANTPTTIYTGLSLKKTTNDFFGMYTDAGTKGKPFYGYALNGVANILSILMGVLLLILV